MSRWKYVPVMGIALLLAASCKLASQPVPRRRTTNSAATNQQTFQVKGIVKGTQAGWQLTVVVQHEAIPNYMPPLHDHAFLKSAIPTNSAACNPAMPSPSA